MVSSRSSSLLESNIRTTLLLYYTTCCYSTFEVRHFWRISSSANVERILRYSHVFASQQIKDLFLASGILARENNRQFSQNKASKKQQELHIMPSNECFQNAAQDIPVFYMGVGGAGEGRRSIKHCICTICSQNVRVFGDT